MAATNIMRICESLWQSGHDYCVLCLRTAESRRLSKSKALSSVLELMENAHVWPWKSRPKVAGVTDLLLCYICEARIVTARRMLEAIQIGILFEKLLHHQRDAPKSAAQLKVAIDNVEDTAHKHKQLPLYRAARLCGAGVTRARRATAARHTDVLTLDSRPELTDYGRLDLTQTPMTPVTPATPVPPVTPVAPVTPARDDAFNIIIENDIRMGGDESPAKGDPIATFVIDDDSNDSSCDGPQHIVMMPQNINAAPQMINIAPQPSNTAPQRVKNAPKRAVAPQPAPVMPPLPPMIRMPNVSADTMPLLGIQNTGLSTIAGHSQLLAVRCADSDNFILHQIVTGTDGVQYLPTMPGCILGGSLQPVSDLSANTQSIPTRTVPTTNIVYAPQPKPSLQELLQEKPARLPRLLRNVVDSDVVGVTITIDPDEGPPEVTPEVPHEMPPAVPPSVPRTLPRAPSADEPPCKKPGIDWEDKIPMDVISYMNATDPHAATNTLGAASPLGIISNVYSQAETAAAADAIQNEMII